MSDNDRYLRDVVAAMVAARDKGALLSESMKSPFFSNLSYDDKKSVVAAYLASSASIEHKQTGQDTVRQYAIAAKKGAGDQFWATASAVFPVAAAAVSYAAKNASTVPGGKEAFAKKILFTPALAKIIGGVSVGAGLVGAINGIITRKQANMANEEYESGLRSVLGTSSDPELIAKLMYPTVPSNPIINMIKGSLVKSVNTGAVADLDAFAVENSVVNPN